MYSFIASAGFLVGRAMLRGFPSLYATGSLIWALALPVYLAIVIFSIVFGSVKETFGAMIIPSPKDDEGLGAVLFTIPTLSICAYSLGMIITHRRK